MLEQDMLAAVRIHFPERTIRLSNVVDFDVVTYPNPNPNHTGGLLV